MDNNCLLSALDNAGIEYSSCKTLRGVDYARFIWSTNDSDTTQLTAIYEEGVARLTAHSINVSPQSIPLLDRAKDLPLGAVYISPEENLVELSVGLFIDNRILSSEQIIAIINYVDCARRYLEGYFDSCHFPQLLRDKISCDSDIFNVLKDLGHEPVSVKNGVDVGIKILGYLTYQSEIIDLNNGWIRATTYCSAFRQLRFDDEELLLMHKLQRWATSGRFIISNDGDIVTEVCTPYFDVNHDKLVTWTTSQSVLLLRTAAEHYKLIE